MLVVVINSDADLSCIYMLYGPIWYTIRRKLDCLDCCFPSEVQAPNDAEPASASLLDGVYLVQNLDVVLRCRLTSISWYMCVVCVTRWMARCKQPESEDWLDADQWTCQSMPKWLVAAVSNRLWKSLDLSTLFDHILRKAVLTEARCKRHEHGTNKQTSDVSAIDTSTSQSCTAKNPQK